MDRNQVRAALLKITIAVLALTSWVFWGTIYTSRPDEVSAAGAVPEDTLETLIRLPASLPAKLAPSTKVLPPIKMDIFKLACWDMKDESNHGTDARWVRLTGHPCQARDRDSVTVRNLSNGYVATVFTAGKNDLTTDFIPLQMGQNDILIRFENEPGSSLESRFLILRE